jgi:cytochrome b involved in lipid metabolism
MASYLRSWLPTLPSQQSSPAATEEQESSPTTPTQPSSSIQSPDDDSPPAFPALESAQRMSSAPSSSSAQLTALPTLMPPPPLPAPRKPGPPAPSSASSHMPPPTTTKPPTQLSKTKKREEVVLAPGHSPLDWAALKSSGTDLRACLSLLVVDLCFADAYHRSQSGMASLARIPPSVLRDDAWAAINGKVYNTTPYLAFHPGGEKELMRIAGRDGTRLFCTCRVGRFQKPRLLTTVQR